MVFETRTNGVAGFSWRGVPLAAGLLLVCACLTGCEVVDKHARTNDDPEAVSEAAVENPGVTPTAPSSAAMWPAYDAPKFFGHGFAGEDSYRQSAINGARAAGLDCIRVVSPQPPSDEAAMHLLHFKSPVDGHMLHPSWYDNALEGGVSRWVIDIGSGAELGRWQFLTKDYPGGSIQWIVQGGVVSQ